MDFESGVWCTSLGHNNRHVNEAIIKQMNIISHAGYRYSNKIVDEAVEKVLNLFGYIDGKCVFLSSGSEAVEFAVQAVKKIMNKPYFLCLNGYFLSSYGLSAARNKEEWISLDLTDYKGDPSSFLKNIPFDKIGAFIFEPGNASGTVKLPPEDLVKMIEVKIRENNGFIVVDEVTTGVGRTGKSFGYEYYDISPDIVAFGKGIGNGYPVSVIALSKQVALLIEKSGLKYAQSHQNDPLGCAVVKEVISIIEHNNYIQRASEIGLVLEHELNLLLEKYKCIKEVRGRGLMFVIEFIQYNDFPLEKIHRDLFDAGFITGLSIPANLLRFYPPLTIEREQIKGLVNALSNILSKY
ncbi:MAG TPA: aminotransferase class III-fold pyridoxal phosphate-dependent enzyme [Clostridiales bacterium]|nr:aminotransferase class III-fold pyridoxal phosphate-dependent enzyme [Clostridiales bacterium]